jgi:hypothetical protein
MFPTITEMIITYYHSQLFCQDGVSQTFCPDWPLTTVLLISVTRVARIAGMSHHTWLTHILCQIHVLQTLSPKGWLVYFFHNNILPEQGRHSKKKKKEKENDSTTKLREKYADRTWIKMKVKSKYIFYTSAIKPLG